MLASNDALMELRSTSFFSFLYIQTWERMEEVRKTSGKQSSTSKSSKITLSGVRSGSVFLREVMRNSLAELTWEQSSKEWSTVSDSRPVQSSQFGFSMFGIFILKSLDLVGSMLWIMRHVKLDKSEGRPGVEITCQIFSQSFSG